MRTGSRQSVRWRRFGACDAEQSLGHGFQALSDSEAMVINVVTRPYDRDEPDELRRPAHGDIPFEWER